MAGDFYEKIYSEYFNDENCTTENLMDILLAHEVAHTLGLEEVYLGFYGAEVATNHQLESPICIMNGISIKGINELRESDSQHLCNDCKGFLLSEFPYSADAYENTFEYLRGNNNEVNNESS